MKVLLLADVKGQGKKDQIVEVSWVIFFITDFKNWLALSIFPED